MNFEEFIACESNSDVQAGLKIRRDIVLPNIARYQVTPKNDFEWSLCVVGNSLDENLRDYLKKAIIFKNVPAKDRMIITRWALCANILARELTYDIPNSGAAYLEYLTAMGVPARVIVSDGGPIMLCRVCRVEYSEKHAACSSWVVFPTKLPAAIPASEVRDNDHYHKQYRLAIKPAAKYW